jgi:hypothetical protein
VKRSAKNNRRINSDTPEAIIRSLSSSFTVAATNLAFALAHALVRMLGLCGPSPQWTSERWQTRPERLACVSDAEIGWLRVTRREAKQPASVTRTPARLNHAVLGVCWRRSPVWAMGGSTITTRAFACTPRSRGGLVLMVDLLYEDEPRPSRGLRAHQHAARHRRSSRVRRFFPVGGCTNAPEPKRRTLNRTRSGTGNRCVLRLGRVGFFGQPQGSSRLVYRFAAVPTGERIR